MDAINNARDSLLAHLATKTPSTIAAIIEKLAILESRIDALEMKILDVAGHFNNVLNNRATLIECQLGELKQKVLPDEEQASNDCQTEKDDY